MKISDFDLQQKVSSQVAFLVILVFTLVVGMVSVSIGEKIINSTPGKNLKETTQISRTLLETNDLNAVDSLEK